MAPFVAIVNPAAGSGRCRGLARSALERLRGQGVVLEACETRGPGDASRLAEQAYRQGTRQLIAVGGDGTAFEILNGLSAALEPGGDPSDRVSLGFLPLGTGNSFLRDFGAGDVEQALSAIATDRRRACDVLRLETTGDTLYSLNLLSFGFVAEICAITNARFKALGTPGYGLGVVTALAKLRPIPLRMRLDGGALWEQDMVFVSICNSRFTGGSMMMAPYAETNDGQLDVIVCGPMDRRTLLATFPKIFSGRHVHHHQISAARAKTVELFEAAPLDLMIDGEVVRAQPKRLDVLASAIDVLV